MTDDEGRRRHYGEFYGLTALPDTPLGLIVGNCQAESLRVALGACDVHLVRMPAVHELVADDMPHLQRLLARAAVLISQPVRDDYHGLPVGTRQLSAALPAGGRTLTVPTIRFAGLYPWHAIVRPPSDPGATPPIAAYHDLRVLVEAATGTARRPRLERATALAVAEESVGQLERRERAHGALQVSDLFARPRFDLMRTINHPGNDIWTAVADRVRDRLTLGGGPSTLDRPILDSIHAPREPEVIDAWGLDDEPRDHWVVDGRRIPTAEVDEAHRRWYRDRPEVVAAGLERHAGTIATLGLA